MSLWCVYFWEVLSPILQEPEWQLAVEALCLG